MKSVISPSMMCAALDRNAQVLEEFRTYNEQLDRETRGSGQVGQVGRVGFLHIDIMDGLFVPNFALSPDYCRQIKSLTDIPLDIHLMVSAPEVVMGWLMDDNQGGMVSVHGETVNETGMRRCGAMARARGMKLFAALNPETPVETVLPYIDELAGILIMAVHPGFAGQKMVPGTLEKIASCRRWLDRLGYREIAIEVDGNVSPENAEKMRAAGADIFVAGTASVFKEGAVSQERLQILRKAVSP